MAEEDNPIEQPADEPADPPIEQPVDESPDTGAESPPGPVDDPTAHRARFEQLTIEDLGDVEKFVERYDDVPMKVSIELGRVPKSLKEILEWKEGSIVETKKLSGMPMEIMVNGSLFGLYPDLSTR